MKKLNKLAHDYVRRWRVIAMLTNIRAHLYDADIEMIINRYIQFAETIDEDKWEREHRGKNQQRINRAVTGSRA